MSVLTKPAEIYPARRYILEIPEEDIRKCEKEKRRYRKKERKEEQVMKQYCLR
jgi:hypothetical protein